MNLVEQSERQNQIVKQIRKQFPQTQFPNVKRENLYHGLPKKENYLEGHQAVMGDEGVYSFVSDAYTLVRHEVLANKVIQSLQNLKQKPKISFQFPNKGAKMRMNINFDSEFKKLAKVGDKIAPSFRIKNSYDKQWIMSIAYGARELVCSNGMTVFKVEATSTKKKHMGLNINADLLMIDQQDLFTEEIKTFLDNFNLQIEYYKSWNDLKIESGKYQEEIKPSMPFTNKEHEELEEMPIIGRKTTFKQMLEKNNLTLWEVSRCATQYCTHNLKDNPTKAISYEESIAKSLDGVYSQLAH